MEDQGGKLDFKLEAANRKGGGVPDKLQEPFAPLGPRRRKPNSRYTRDQWANEYVKQRTMKKAAMNWNRAVAQAAAAAQFFGLRDCMRTRNSS
ncbi:hypothetical protein OsJ_02443 [Oryza sativa Japonica Group]|uniref:Uncharacterized protein n=1 Tax=Oryza sativa subsp. japonica TaxID=39947 RepID=B9EXV0_ORYSJ|nr:hypothetical protein OsJ_02443 [Oryza sativa Japonica Group]